MRGFERPIWGVVGRHASKSLWLALWLAAVPDPAFAAARRVALVIGISHYQSVPSLANPQSDAGAVAKSLRDDGFEVTELTQPKDLDRTPLSAAISAFRRTAVGAEAALIYYAGHGVEAGGRNWLLPADAKAQTPDELEASAIATVTLVGAVSGATMVRLVILDACRDNPFADMPGMGGSRSVGGSRGLARETNLPPNVVVLLATQPGTKASDSGGGANSPFARALSVALTNPDLRLSTLPTMVSRQMRALSGVEQRPDQQGIFDEPDWRFTASATGPAPVNVPMPSAIASPVYAAPAPAIASAKGFGLVLQSRGNGQPGLIVSEVAAGSPFDGTIQPNDVILKLNSSTPAGPQSVIGALQQDRRASISLQRAGQGIPTSTLLSLPKETDE